MLKHCYRCSADKPLSDFHRTAARPDGLSAICKECQKEKDRLRYEAGLKRPPDPEQAREYFREYYQKNRQRKIAEVVAYRRRKRAEKS